MHEHVGHPRQLASERRPNLSPNDMRRRDGLVQVDFNVEIDVML